MVRRRTQSDPLAPSARSRWYVVRSMTGAVLESHELPRDADLKRAFIVAMLEWMDAGWTLGEFSSASATFFCDRFPERRMISIDQGDPLALRQQGAYPGACTACED